MQNNQFQNLINIKKYIIVERVFYYNRIFDTILQQLYHIIKVKNKYDRILNFKGVQRSKMQIRIRHIW